MKRAISYGTWIVVAHLLVNVLHGIAHLKLHVELDPGAKLFVIVFILILPLAAMVLLWASQARLGLLLLATSMGSSLIFGMYKHFGALGPDRIGQHAPGPWGTIFAVTAYLLMATEAVGTYIALRFLI